MPNKIKHPIYINKKYYPTPSPTIRVHGIRLEAILPVNIKRRWGRLERLGPLYLFRMTPIEFVVDTCLQYNGFLPFGSCRIFATIKLEEIRTVEVLLHKIPTLGAWALVGGQVGRTRLSRDDDVAEDALALHCHALDAVADLELAASDRHHPVFHAGSCRHESGDSWDWRMLGSFQWHHGLTRIFVPEKQVGM